MANEQSKVQRKQTPGRIRALLRKKQIDDPDKENATRSRFLAILKTRHGYTSDKAETELERLVKQFYSINRRSGIRRVWPYFKRPRTDNQ